MSRNGRHKHHERHDLPPEQCGQCVHERAECRAKRQYPSHEAAVLAANAKNEATGYRYMLATYPCPWCHTFHLTKAKWANSKWKHAEKRRRRWLVRQTQGAAS